MIKNEELSYLKSWDVSNLYAWAMSQKLPLGGFKWIEDASLFKKFFIKNYNEDSDIEYFIEADVQYLQELHELHSDLPF